jgi:HD-GYP domain-containing protein (c-di-GMP phosphodiesterase class II)
MPGVETLLNIGIALSKEKNVDKLIEIIIDSVMELVDCDGGTLYLLENDRLHFKIMITKSLGFRKGGDNAEGMPPPMRLTRESMCARAVMEKKLINIDDVYGNKEFDFAGSKKVDDLMGYNTKSMLIVPMEDDYGDVIGVLQLINALDENGSPIPFAREYERVLLSIASQAAICLTNRKYASELISLLDSFVIAMSAAIDARSPYNANHSRNMAKYGKKFVQWLNEGNGERFDSERERKFLMSLLLHDIGKLVVPREVMDKETRLGPRLYTVLNRLQAFRMQAEINYLRGTTDEAVYRLRAQEAEDAQLLVERVNRMGLVPDDVLKELRALCEKTGTGPGGEEPYLTPEEQACLLVRRGTLTDDERVIMEGHVLMTQRILSQVRFPRNYRMVPVWAAAHHEYLNGKGYPNRLTAEEIPTEVRIATILDVYDALTAYDRPYKRAIPVEEAFSILDDMAAEGQIDAGLLAQFKDSGAWAIEAREGDAL